MAKQTLSCTHERVTQIGRDYGFGGSVAASADFENRAAHGCITYTVECDSCGARQRRNQNQNHIERGPWGETRGQRSEAAQRAANDAARLRWQARPQVPKSLTVTNNASGLAVVASCDPETGELVIEAGTHEAWRQIQGKETAIMAALPSEWIDAAIAVREHHQRVARADTLAADLREAVSHPGSEPQVVEL